MPFPPARFRLPVLRVAALTLLLLLATALGPVAGGVPCASAQVPLAPLWPNEDGMSWPFRLHVVELPEGIDTVVEGSMTLEGTTVVPGGLAQNLIAQHGPITRLAPGNLRSGRSLAGRLFGENPPALPGLLRRVWLARPDLRERIEERYADSQRMDPGPWWPNFLHGGYLLKTADRIEMWQDEWNHSTWTYLAAPVEVGQTFVHQLVPELADDIFLHGTVTAIDAAVSTPAGAFSPVVKMEYLIDYGISEIVDEMGTLLGTFHGETTGHVQYAPGVGPVDLLEEFVPYVWAECPGGPCPPEIEDYIGVPIQTIMMQLTGQPTPAIGMSWGSARVLYR
jgi:hypothetical protein